MDSLVCRFIGEFYMCLQLDAGLDFKFAWQADFSAIDR